MSVIEKNPRIQAKLEKIFALSPSELKSKAYRTLIKQKLIEIRSEIFTIVKRHGIKDIFDFDKRFQEGLIPESEGWEDFFELDGLVTEEKELTDILAMLG
jgi:hypothetical protein